MKGKIDLKNVAHNYEWVFVGVIIFLALCIYLYSTWGGLIWTSDSFHYWAASRSFKSDAILVAADGGNYTFWPPLFPVLLSFFSEQSYYLFHTLCFTASLLTIYLYFKRITSKEVALLSLTIFSLTVYPYLICSFLWSEVIFSFLLLLGFYQFELWNFTKKKNVHLVISAVLLSLMCLQRNAGVFFIVGLSAYTLVRFLTNKNWILLLKMAVLNIIIVTPNLLWNINQRIQNPQEYNFQDNPFAVDFFTNLNTFTLELIRLVFPANASTDFLIIIILGFSIYFFLFLSMRDSLHFYLIVAYIFFFLLMPKDEFSETGRFLAPLFPFIILQFVTATKSIVSHFSSYKIKFLIYSLLVILLSYNIARTAKNVRQWNFRSIHHPKSAKIFF